MALPTADVGIKPLPAGFAARGAHPNLLLDERKRPLQSGQQRHVCTGVGHQNFRHRTGLAKVALPGQRRRRRIQQPAFFTIAAAIIIAKKVCAFFTSRCTHEVDPVLAGNPVTLMRLVRQAASKICLQLYAGHVCARGGINADCIAHFDKAWHLYL